MAICQEATQQFSWIIWIFTLLLSETASKKSQTFYMESADCDTHAVVSGATVYSHRGIHGDQDYGDDVSCRITFQAATADNKNDNVDAWRLSLRVERLDIPDTSYNHLCNDALYVFDAKRIYGRAFPETGGMNGMCGTDPPPVLYSSGPYITVYFRTDKGGVTGKGFKMVVTAYHKDDQHHDCGESFHCANHMCLDKGLLCDGEDHCGDGSDESKEEPLHCGADTSFLGKIFSFGIIAAVAITAGSVILVVVIVVCLVCCICKCSKKKRETALSAQSSPSAANVTEALTNGGPGPCQDPVCSPGLYHQHNNIGYYPLPQQVQQQQSQCSLPPGPPPHIPGVPSAPSVTRTYSPFLHRDSYSQASGFSGHHAPPSYHRSYTPTSSKSGRSHHSGVAGGGAGPHNGGPGGGGGSVSGPDNYVRYHHDQEKVAFPVHV